MTAPAHAIILWADEHNIYAAPQTQPDKVMVFPYMENGLRKALLMLGAARTTEGSPTYERPQVVPKNLVKEHLTLEDLANASKALRDLGIIK